MAEYASRALKSLSELRAAIGLIVPHENSSLFFRKSPQKLLKVLCAATVDKSLYLQAKDWSFDSILEQLHFLHCRLSPRNFWLFLKPTVYFLFSRSICQICQPIPFHFANLPSIEITIISYNHGTLVLRKFKY